MNSQEEPTRNLKSATAWMAIGTGASRFTGVLRIVALAFALGQTHLADAYNLANTTPNMIYDVVLGGIMMATFIPVFADQFAKYSERDAMRSISAVITLSGVILVCASIAFWFAAPILIDGLTALDKPAHALSSYSVASERAVAVTLLRWFVPQIAFYGFIAIATALLNIRRRFIVATWVPIVNNIISISVLLWFAAIAGSNPTLLSVEKHHSQLMLLGLGTTLGVAIQAVVLIVNLRGARLELLRWRWDPRDQAVLTVLRLSGWTFGFILANQATLFVILALAGGTHGSDPVSSYTYAYSFLLMPYAVVAVSVMSAVTPELAEYWSAQNLAGFTNRLSKGLRAILAIIIPAAIGMILLARPVIGLLLGHGHTTAAGASQSTGAALAMFSLGLPGFCTYLYVVRILQAMQQTRTAFWLYLIENGLNVGFALLLVGPIGVRGLALSLSIAYTVAAIIGLLVLRHRLGPLGQPQSWSSLRRASIISVVMGLVVLVTSSLWGATSEIGSLFKVVFATGSGVATYAGAAYLMARRNDKKARLHQKMRTDALRNLEPASRIQPQRGLPKKPRE